MTEHEQAKAWMEKRELSVERLSKLTGYGHRSIYWMLRGMAPPNAVRPARPISEAVWQRFKIACAGVDAQIRAKNRFDW